MIYRINPIIFLILLVSAFFNCDAQAQNVRQLQEDVSKAVAKAYQASVRIWGFDTIKKEQNSSQFSGVVVDKSGTILTVSHAIKTNGTYKVRFPDGREAMAVALGKMGFPEMQSRPDLGMMKLSTTGDWPVAEIGWSYSLKKNEPCISIAYPETLNQLLPTVRFGRITNVMNEFGFVESSCKMEPGDSGGPLFDYMGRVIGLHSRCLEYEDGNYEVPIDLYRKYWTALRLPEDYLSFPESTDSIKKDPLESKIISLRFLESLSAALSKPAGVFKGTCMIIQCLWKDRTENIYTTVFEDNGKIYLVGKSSLITDTASLNLNGRKVALQVLSRDPKNDLALLLVPFKVGKPIAVDGLEKEMLLTQDALGSFLISPLSDDYRVSVLSSMIFNLPKKFSIGYLGAALNFKDGKAIITKISQNSPSASAGMQIGDSVEQVNGVPINSTRVYNEEMSRYMPGDSLKIEGISKGNLYSRLLVLSRRPTGSHIADKFAGGKSIRLDGFNKVIAHDAIIRPDECGGPVFTCDGKFLGINIARFSRTSTIIMPSLEVKRFIDRSVASLKRAIK